MGIFRSPELLVKDLRHASACCAVIFESYTDYHMLDHDSFGEAFFDASASMRSTSSRTTSAHNCI